MSSFLLFILDLRFSDSCVVSQMVVCCKELKSGHFSITAPGTEEEMARGGMKGSRRNQHSSVPSLISVPRFPKLCHGDGRDAFVWLSRGHEAGQTVTLVGSFCVPAVAVLTQRHLVADVLTLVYVCEERRHEVLVEGSVGAFAYL